MTRSVVQQARTQGRPTTPEIPGAAGGAGGELTADGWVSVENHKRKHKHSGGSASTAASSSSAGTSGRHRNGDHERSGGNGREMRRTQSAVDSTSATGDEPPVARPNARADALSAAVALDKKARERSYYASGNGAASPPASLSSSSTPTWGSPPPGLAPQRGMNRSNSMSPDASSALSQQLERSSSSLQKLMSSWQLSDDTATDQQLQPGGQAGGVGNPRGNTRNAAPTRSGGDRSGEPTLGGGMFDFAFSDVPPADSLRRTQSDLLPASMSLYPNGNNRQRSPTTPSTRTSTTPGYVNPNNPNGSAGPQSSTTTTNGSTNGNGRKCGDKRDFFFRHLEFETRSLLQIDDVAAFSVTDFEMARKISLAIIDLFPDIRAYMEQQLAADAFFYGLSGQDPQLQPTRKYPLIITDATACVGGNVLSFCDYFHFVYAIENDATRVTMLENNVRVLGKTNVACRCASYLEVMYEYEQDVIFFDPPWGGPEYKDQDKVDLYLDEQPLYEICEQLHGCAKVIVLKVPTNFDDEKFAYCVSGRVTVRRDFKKMHLVVLDFR
jgi:hypothetical protein